MSTAFDRLVDALADYGVKVRGDEATARCPGHDDVNPSLGLRRIEGSVLVTCRAFCDTADVLAALNMSLRDLYDDPKGATYAYDDGRTVHRTPDKKFRQSGNTKGKPSLYRLGKVTETVANGVTVALVEGEKDVHAIESLGGIATTAPMGAANFGKVDVTPLTGAHVVVIPDQDDAGAAWLATVRENVAPIAASFTVKVPKVGKDAADHIAAGYGLDDLDDPPTDDGAALLDDVRDFFARFVAFPSPHALVAVVLWAVHTHLVDRFDSTPRLALLSAEKQSGKSRTLELLELVAAGAEFLVGASVSFIFRLIGTENVTLMIDEADTVWTTKKGGDESAEALRGIVNSGHRKGATVGRVEMVGQRAELRRFPVYAPAAVAGIDKGQFPDTILDRSVIVRMRRRAPDEHIDEFRERTGRPAGEALRDRIAAWTDQVADKVGCPWPDMPEGVRDRPADVWEPLLMVADLAGGDWPKLAREACKSFVTGSTDDTASIGVRLLADLLAVFRDGNDIVSARSTTDIVSSLRAMDEAPWGDWYGRDFTGRDLGKMLKPYGVKSGTVRIDGEPVRGYKRADLWDPWTRYGALSEGSVTSGTSVTPLASAVTLVTDVTDTPQSGNPADEPCSDPTHTPVFRGGRWSCPDCEENAA